MADVATVWWIEADSGELRSQSFGPNDIAGSETFEHEVVIKYARDPIELTTIMHNRAGNEWERRALNQLKQKAAEVRQALVGAGAPPSVADRSGS